MDDVLKSRFVCNSDATSQEFVFRLPESWWSRTFEYEWSKNFCRETDVVLDAACGIEHPLKFYLLDHCRECHACDLDDRLVDRGLMARLCAEAWTDADEVFPTRYLDAVHYEKASLSAMPYADGTFDRVFCISVLEHLKDSFNKWPVLRAFAPLLAGARRDIRDSLIEFKRVLRPDGLIVLTFDYPRINLSYLKSVVSEAGLRFAGEVDFELPRDAIRNAEKGLNCFRAVLTHAEADAVTLDTESALTADAIGKAA